MAFKNYQVIVFDEKTGRRKSLRFRNFYFVVMLLIIGVLMVGNVFLGKHFLETQHLNNELNIAYKKLDNMNSNLVSLVSELDTLKEDIYRIRQFDSKLKILVGDNYPESEGMGTGGISSFDLNLVPLHRQELATKKIHSFIADLKKEIQLEEIMQQDLMLYIKDSSNKLAATPSLWPVLGGTLTSKFGMRKSPFTGVSRLHKGIDIAAPIGTPIIAPADGKVIFSGNDGAYGISLEIDHGHGIVTRYAHLSKSLVKKGDTVTRNSKIAAVGNTGRSTGPHLHYEVNINGVPTNPMAYIIKD